MADEKLKAALRRIIAKVTRKNGELVISVNGSETKIPFANSSSLPDTNTFQ